jgi:hypothetical protein
MKTYPKPLSPVFFFFSLWIEHFEIFWLVVSSTPMSRNVRVSVFRKEPVLWLIYILLKKELVTSYRLINGAIYRSPNAISHFSVELLIYIIIIINYYIITYFKRYREITVFQNLNHCGLQQ